MFRMLNPHVIMLCNEQKSKAMCNIIDKHMCACVLHVCVCESETTFGIDQEIYVCVLCAKPQSLEINNSLIGHILVVNNMNGMTYVLEL